VEFVLAPGIPDSEAQQLIRADPKPMARRRGGDDGDGGDVQTMRFDEPEEDAEADDQFSRQLMAADGSFAPIVLDREGLRELDRRQARASSQQLVLRRAAGVCAKVGLGGRGRTGRSPPASSVLQVPVPQRAALHVRRVHGDAALVQR
jgi:hypothetical protein